MLTPAAPGVAPRAMAPADVDDLVALQLTALEGSLLNGLGPDFLARMYALAMAQPATRGFVVRDGAGMAACALGSLDAPALRRQAAPRLLPALARALAAPPRWPLGLRLLHGLLEPGPRPAMPAELLLLVVATDYRRQGLGRALLAALETEFRGQGVARYRVAVRSRLGAAQAFYGALGFEPEQERPVLGEPMTFLTKRLLP